MRLIVALTCRVCKEEKSKEEFSFQHRKLNPDKRKTICKRCDCDRSIAYGKQFRKKRIEYYRDYYHTINGHTLNLWSALNNRVRRKKSYIGLPVTFTKEQFLNWIRNNKEYWRLFAMWKEASYEPRYTPTVDRIDNQRGYEPDNVQVLVQYENSRKNWGR